MNTQTNRVLFYICLGAAIALLATGFILPPMGEIHPSTLKGAGIIIAFYALRILELSLLNGKEITVRHGETEVVVGDDDNKK